MILIANLPKMEEFKNDGKHKESVYHHFITSFQGIITNRINFERIFQRQGSTY